MTTNCFVFDDGRSEGEGEIAIEYSVLSVAPDGNQVVRTLRALLPAEDEDKALDQERVESRFERLLFEYPLQTDTDGPMRATLTLKDVRRFWRVIFRTFEIEATRSAGLYGPVAVEILDPPYSR